MYVELYTKDDCTYCSRTKLLLTYHNIPFTEQKLGKDFTREFLVEKFSTAKAFPVIVVDGFYIGGYNNLMKLIESQHQSDSILLQE